MISSQNMSLTNDHLTKEDIDAHEFAYSRQRLKNCLFETVLKAFVDRYHRDGFTKRDLAVALKRDPALVTRWLAGPGNWELNTISDLMRAMRAELQVSYVLFEDKCTPNFEHKLAIADYQDVDVLNVDIQPDPQMRIRSFKVSSHKSHPAPSVAAFVNAGQTASTNSHVHDR